MKNNSSHWQRNTIPYDVAYVADSLKNFRREQLADPDLACRWFEFAKHFSQMELSPNQVEQLGFQNFHALKQIMASTLTGLSEETVRQNNKIASLEKEQKVLRRDLQRLSKIEQENQKKEDKLKEEIQKLDRKQSELSMEVEEESLYD